MAGAPETVSHGGTASDNNFQMDGVDVNDIQASGHFSGGIPIPNPDSIEEFKVQTGQYDAAYGRNAGANVNVVTKSGTNQFHGNLWEYFRNEKLNANDFFLNETGQPRGILRQNQFGGTFGGPIKKDKIFFFGSYQGTRQLNGLGSGCSSAFSSPPLTNDRSAAAIGRLFAGQRGVLQDAFGGVGPAIAADGSNINPAALALLQFKLPNRQYLIPTPQTVDPSKPFDVQGFSAFSIPCTFSEDQYVANGDYLQSDKSKFSVRFFLANDNQNVTLPPSQLATTSPGFPAVTSTQFRSISFSHSYSFGPNLFNEADFGFNITHVNLDQKEAFKYSDVGITVPAFDNTIPAIGINGSLALGGNGQGQLLDRTTYTLKDSLSYTLGRHSLRFGGGFTRYLNDITDFHFYGGMLFLSFPDFLLGLNAAENGTGLFSNVYVSLDLPALFDRRWRILDGDAFVQDDFKVTPRLTLNLGFRYERLGGIGDNLGRNTAFYFGLADPNPPATGSLDGFVVASNYKGTIPPGVTQAGNNLAINGDGQNSLNPRIGFAYRLPHTERFVLRGGYGIFHSRVTGQPFLQLLTGQPFADLRYLHGNAQCRCYPAGPVRSGPNPAVFHSVYADYHAQHHHVCSRFPASDDPDLQHEFTKPAR